MANRITPNRNEVNATFRSASFRIRTDVVPAWVEIALATDPALFAADAKPRRTRETFYSTREVGPIPVPGGDAVWIAPEDVLERFVGQPRLYYALAVFPAPDRKDAQIMRVAPEAAPFVAISRSFTGARRRLAAVALPTAPAQPGYGRPPGDDRSLEWAGDAAMPGVEPGAAPAPVNGGAAADTPAAEQRFVYRDGLEEAFGPVEEIEAEAAEDATRGIDGPIPDEDAAYAEALEEPAPEDPYSSRFISAHSGNFRRRSAGRGPRTIEQIVIHITDGGSRLMGTVSWFRNPEARVSSHYIVGRDGEIVQMVRHNDVAWHANNANGNSIGIEHNANTRGLMPTDPQYRASAKLVAWLCRQYGLPVDRDHILGHSEADTRTTHTSCPNAVWDWETYMQMVYEEAAALGNGSGGNGASAQSLVAPLAAIDVRYDDVEPIGQPTGVSCWAAAAAMIVGWRDRISIDPEEFARRGGRWAEYDESGLYTNDNDELAHAWGLVAEPPMNYTIDGFAQLLRDNGPLWVGRLVDGSSGHAVAVYGLVGDGTPDGTEVLWHDPWAPGQGTPSNRATYQQFMTEFEDFVTVDPNGRVNNQILHGNGRRPVTTSQAVARPQAAIDIEWADVESLGQPTNVSCWAAAAAMVVGWRDRISINPEEFARLEGRWSEYNQTGLWTSNNDEFAAAWGLTVEPPMSYAVEGFAAVLENSGPLWVGRLVNGSSGHAVCVYGLRGDGTPDGTQVIFHDPWPPNQGHAARSVTYATFMQEFEDFITVDAEGRVNNQILHSGGTDGRTPNTSYAYGLGSDGRGGAVARPLALYPIHPDDVARLRAEYVANASASDRRNCITIMNAALRELYGAALRNDDGSQKALGSTVQATMAALVGYGLAQSPQVFEFLDSRGRVTKGVIRPEQLASSVEQWLVQQADSEKMSGWFLFGLSLMDGYHSVVLALDFNGPGDPLTNLYWADQIHGGWDPVIGALDARITAKTQGWWDPLPQDRKARTRVTVWALNP